MGGAPEALGRVPVRAGDAAFRHRTQHAVEGAETRPQPHRGPAARARRSGCPPPCLKAGHLPLARARYGAWPSLLPFRRPGTGVGTSPGDPSPAQLRQWVEVGRDRVERAERPVPALRPAAPQDALAGSGCWGRGPESAERPHQLAVHRQRRPHQAEESVSVTLEFPGY